MRSVAGVLRVGLRTRLAVADLGPSRHASSQMLPFRLTATARRHACNCAVGVQKILRQGSRVKPAREEGRRWARGKLEPTPTRPKRDASGYRQLAVQSNPHDNMPTPLHISHTSPTHAFICRPARHGIDPNSPIRCLSSHANRT
jgi:hypothetical protein